MACRAAAIRSFPLFVGSSCRVLLRMPLTSSWVESSALARKLSGKPLGAFDPPENVTSCGQRDCTVVPNQALTLLNNLSVREQAGAFAARLLRETNGNPEAVADRAWLIAYGRKITADERADAVAFLRAREKAVPATVTDARKAAITEMCVALFNTNEFIYLR